MVPSKTHHLSDIHMDSLEEQLQEASTMSQLELGTPNKHQGLPYQAEDADMGSNG